MKHPMKGQPKQLNEMAQQDFATWTKEDFLAEIGRLVLERDEARRDLAISRARERDALRRGFEAALALDDSFQVRFPEFEDFEKHLAGLEEDAACEARISEAEEKEPL